MRHKLPATRPPGTTHVANLGGTKFFITINCFPDGKPGEIFIKTQERNRHGLQGWADSIAELVSMLLQSDDYSLDLICRHLRGSSFPPEGFTGSDELGYAKSLPDYLGRYMQTKYLTETNKQTEGGAE